MPTPPTPEVLRVFRSNRSEGYPSEPWNFDISVLPSQSSPFPTIIAGYEIGNANYNQGYPIPDVSMGDVSVMKVQTRPYPKLQMSAGAEDIPYEINESYPCNIDMGDISHMKAQTRPYPRLQMSAGADDIPYEINESYPCKLDVGDISHKNIQEKPFPNLLSSIEPDVNEGYPAFRKVAPSFGACSNIPTLEEIEIPKSVKWIDDYAFYNTKISKVKIAADCMYFRHSFPRGTRIAFYKDD